MPKLKPESLFPPSILPPEFQISLAGEIKEKLARAKDQLPAEPMYYEPANFAERIMLKMLGKSTTEALPKAPLLFLQRGKRNYQGAVNRPFKFSVTGGEDSREEFSEGPFPSSFAAAMAYLHQECDGIQAMRFDIEAANDLGVHTTAEFGDSLRGFANQISLFAKTTPLGTTPQAIIETVAKRQVEMYQTNLTSNKTISVEDAQDLSNGTIYSSVSPRVKKIYEQEDGFRAVLHGQRLLSRLLLFSWEEPDSGKLLVSPE